MYPFFLHLPESAPFSSQLIPGVLYNDSVFVHASRVGINKILISLSLIGDARKHVPGSVIAIPGLEVLCSVMLLCVFPFLSPSLSPKAFLYVCFLAVAFLFFGPVPEGGRSSSAGFLPSSSDGPIHPPRRCTVFFYPSFSRIRVFQNPT